MGKLYLQTNRESGALFGESEIRGFLASIEDAGGRSDLTIREFVGSGDGITANATEFTLFRVGTGLMNGEWNNALAVIDDDADPHFPAGLGNFYLIYVDINNWSLFEIATQFSGTISFGYITNVIASLGGFTRDTIVSVYSGIDATSNTDGINVEDFIDFFSTNTPVLTPYTLDTSLGNTITDSDGDTEIILGGGALFLQSTLVPTFTFLANENDFVTGDIIRIRLYEDDADQATSTPIIDVTKQISEVLTPTVGALNIPASLFGTGYHISVIFTSDGINTLSNNSVSQYRRFTAALNFVGNASFDITVTTTTISFSTTENGFGTGSGNFIGDFLDGISLGRISNNAHFGTNVLVYGDLAISGTTVTMSNLMTQDTVAGDAAVTYVPTQIGTFTIIRPSITQATNDPIYFLAADQIRVDRSSQRVALGIEAGSTDGFIIEPEDQTLTIDISTVENGEIGEVLGDVSSSFTFVVNEELTESLNIPLDVGAQNVPGFNNSLGMSINTETETLANGTVSITEFDNTDRIATAEFESGIPTLTDAIEGRLMSGADLVDLTTAELEERGITHEDGLWGPEQFTYSMDTWRQMNRDQGYPDVGLPFMDLGFDSDGRQRIPDGQTLRRAGVSMQPSVSGNYVDDFGDLTEYDANAYYNQHNSKAIQSPKSAAVYGWGGSNQLIGPSQFFGEVASGGTVAQGYITHPSTPMRIDQFSPDIRAKLVMDKIAQIANATFEYPGDNDTDWWDTMIPDLAVFVKTYEGLGVMSDTTELTDGFRAVETGSRVYSDINVVSRAGSNSVKRTLYTFGDIGGVQFTFPDSAPAYFSNGAYTARSNGTYEFIFTGNLTDIGNPGDNFIFATRYMGYDAVIKVNGRTVNEESLGSVSSGNTDDRSWSVTAEINLVVGDVVTAVLEQVSGRGAQTTRGTVTNTTFETERVPLIWEGVSVNPGLQFGELTADEMLNMIVQQLNLVIVPDKTRRSHYRIYQYNDWILRGNRVDWSHKIDETTITYSSLLQDQEKLLIFANAEDDDRLSKISLEQDNKVVYGSITRTEIDSDLADGDKTIGDGFAPLIVASVAPAGLINKPINKDPENGIPHLYEWDGEEATAYKPEPRLGFRRRVNFPGTFYYANGDDNVFAYSGSVRTLSPLADNDRFDINFSTDYPYSKDTVTGAFDLFWGQHINRLYDQRNRKMTCMVQFNPEEYYGLTVAENIALTDDQRSRLTIDNKLPLQLNDTVHYKGNDWLINKITGFPLSSPGLAQVELITYQNDLTTVFTAPRNRFVDDLGDETTSLNGFMINPVDDPDGSGTLIAVPGVLELTLEDSDGNTLEGLNYVHVGAAVNSTIPAATVTITARIHSNNRYGVQASDTTVAIATPSGIVNTVPRDATDGGDVLIDFTITSVDSNPYNEVIITQEVNAQATDAVTVTLNTAEQVTTSVSNGVVSTPQLAQTGRPGDTISYSVFFGAETGFALLTGDYEDNSADITGLTTGVVSDFGDGLIVTYTYLIPTTATADFAITPTLRPVASSQMVTGTRNTLTVNFDDQESYTNVSLSNSQVVVRGVTGDTVDFNLLVQPDFNFRVAEGNWSSGIANGTALPVTGATVSAGNGSQNGQGVTLAYRFTIGNASDIVNVTVVGLDAFDDSANAAPTGFRTITYNESGANFTTSEGALGTVITETFEALENTSATTGHKFTISPLEGSQFTANASGIIPSSQFSITGSNNVGAITTTLVGNAVQLSYDVSVTTGTTLGNIDFTANPEAEPFTLTVNINNQLTDVMLSQSTLQFGFNSQQTNQAIVSSANTFTATSNNDARMLASGDFRAGSNSGITIQEEAFAGGVITMEVVGNYPAVAEDTIISVNLVAGVAIGGRPNEISGNTLTVSVPHAGIPATGGTVSAFVTSNGAWETGTTSGVIGSSGGRYSPTSGFGDGVISVELPPLGNSSNALGIGIVVQTVDGSVVRQISLDQSDQFGRRNVAITRTAYDALTPQPGILYLIDESR